MKNIMKCVILIVFLFVLLLFPAPIIESVKLGLLTWAEKVVPALFPFFVLTRLMIYFQLPQMIGKLLAPIFKYLLKMSPITFFIILMSLISGNPSGPKLATDYYENHLISEKETRGIFYFCNFASPLFIIGTIGVVLYQSTVIGYLMLFAHFVGAIVVFIFCYPYFKTTSSEPIQIKFPTQSFAEILIDCIENSIQTLLRVGGIIVFYYIITATLKVVHVVSMADSMILPLLATGLLQTTEPLIAGFFEFVQGVIKLSESETSLQLKLALTAFCVSFAGLSVHTQTFMFAKGVNVSYLKYFLLRCLHGVMSFSLVWICYQPFTNATEETFLPVISTIDNPYQPFIMLTLMLIGIYYVVKFLSLIRPTYKRNQIKRSV